MIERKNNSPVAAEADPYRQLLNIFRLNQEKSQFVDRAYGSALTNTETFLLLEVASSECSSITEIAANLNLERSIVSRAISSLVRRGYLAPVVTGGDRRRKSFRVSRKAEEFFAVHDQFNNRQLAAQAERINLQELSALQRYFTYFAERLGSQHRLLRAGENPMLVPMRKIVVAAGVLGPSLCGSGYTTVDWQIFSALAAEDGVLRPRDLSRRFKIAPNTLSQILKRYRVLRLLQTAPLAGDRRSHTLALTKEGRAAHARIEASVLALIRKGLAGLAVQEVQQFAAIFARYIGLASGADPQSLMLRSISIEKLSSDEAERFAARGFLLYELVRQNRFLGVPEVLLGRENLCFMLRKDQAAQAVVEFARDGELVRLVNHAWCDGLENSSLIIDFFRTVIAAVLNEWQQTSLLLPQEGQIKNLAQKIGLTPSPELHGYLAGAESFASAAG